MTHRMANIGGTIVLAGVLGAMIAAHSVHPHSSDTSTATRSAPTAYSTATFCAEWSAFNHGQYTTEQAAIQTLSTESVTAGPQIFADWGTYQALKSAYSSGTERVTEGDFNSAIAALNADCR